MRMVNHVYVCVQCLAAKFNLIEWNFLNEVKLFVWALKREKNKQINFRWLLFKRSKNFCTQKNFATYLTFKRQFYFLIHSIPYCFMKLRFALYFSIVIVVYIHVDETVRYGAERVGSGRIGSGQWPNPTSREDLCNFHCIEI